MKPVPSFPFSAALCSLCLLLATPFAAAEVIIDKASAGWSYLNITDGTDPAIADTDFNTTWYNPTTGGYSGGSYGGPAFTTASPSPFHYGGVDGLSGGTTLTRPADGIRYTAYFYKIINVPHGYKNLKISLLADDGAFIYLNGTLVARDGVTDPDTFTKMSSLGGESTYDEPTIIGAPELQPGYNLIAISVHQTNTGSSDLGFDFKLEGDRILVAHNSTGWAVLNPIESASGDGYDPVLGHATQAADADFNTTWRNQALGAYTPNAPAVAYDGPAFTIGNQGPLAYGGVDGIPSPNTTLIIPNTQTRGAVYLIREIDGGLAGHNSATFTLLADDGAYIYINGNLIGVVGDLPSDASNDTWGQETGADGSEATFHTLTVSAAGLIQPGSNLLAVSLHQTNKTSSDIGVSLEMLAQNAVPPTITRGPYLQSASHDRMTVKWRTDVAGDTVLKYGDAPGNLTNTVGIGDLTTDHVVTLTGLTAAATYYYQILTTNVAGTSSAGADTDHFFKTYPTEGSHTPSRIWVIGDSGTTTADKIKVYNSYRTRTGNSHTDAWLMLGDNAYGGGSDTEFQAALFDSYPELLRNTVLWSCQGNHETDYGNSSVYPDIHHFPTAGECGGVASGSELYYSFDHGNIHFICLNSSGAGDIDDFPGNGGMIDWLELDLQTTDKDWIIAYFHHGPYTKGSHDSDIESRHIKARRYMTPLLEKYGVDLVLSGHSHCYERSMLINGHHSNMSTADSTSGTFALGSHGVDTGNGSSLGSVDASGNFLTSGGTGAYQKPLATGETGTIYSIVGASGKISPWDDNSTVVVNPNPHPVFVVNLRVMGSMIINVDGNSLNAQYLDKDNVIRDDFTIIKGSTVEVAATDDSFGEHGMDDTATFTVTRAGATSLAESFTYQISGSATNGTDYSPMLTGTIAFLSGETNKLITVTRSTDDDAEGPETCIVTLTTDTQAAGTGGTQRDKYFLGNNITDTAILTDKPSQEWWFNNFGAATVSNALWESDTDNDGLDRLQEYALGGTVGNNDRNLLPTLHFDGSNLDLLFNKNNALSDIGYKVITSTDLSIWTESGVSTSLYGDANPTGVEAWKGSIPIGAMETKRFIRLEILRQ